MSNCFHTCASKVQGFFKTRVFCTGLVMSANATVEVNGTEKQGCMMPRTVVCAWATWTKKAGVRPAELQECHCIVNRGDR